MGAAPARAFARPRARLLVGQNLCAEALVESLLVALVSGLLTLVIQIFTILGGDLASWVALLLRENICLGSEIGSRVAVVQLLLEGFALGLGLRRWVAHAVPVSAAHRRCTRGRHWRRSFARRSDPRLLSLLQGIPKAKLILVEGIIPGLQSLDLFGGQIEIAAM